MVFIVFTNLMIYIISEEDGGEGLKEVYIDITHHTKWKGSILSINSTK